MIYIIFHDCLNKFDWFSTKATSTQVCRIINENEKFQKTSFFSHFFENYNISTNYIFRVKDAKCTTIIYKMYTKKWHPCTINYALSRMEFLLLIGHICIRDKHHQMNWKKHTNHLISSSHAYHMTHLISSSTMLITIIIFFVSCKDILNFYNNKSLIFIVEVY